MPGTGKTFEVSLVTPDGAAYEGEAEMIIVPGADRRDRRARPARAADRDAEGGLDAHPSGRRRRRARVRDRARASSRCCTTARSRSSTTPSGAARSTTRAARAQLEAAQAELEAIDRGESTADRWQVEQRIRHAENQLAVAAGASDIGQVRVRQARPRGNAPGSMRNRSPQRPRTAAFRCHRRPRDPRQADSQTCASSTS